MGPQCGQERSFLAMAFAAPPSKAGPPKSYPRTHDLRQRDAIKRGSSSIQGERFPKPHILSPQKGDIKKTSNPGHVFLKQEHPLSIVQDDDHPSSKTKHVSRRLDDLNRPVRGVLAHPHRKIPSEVFDIRDRGRELCICGNALWVEHCTESIYQNVCHSNSPFKGERDNDLWLPGRLARCCPFVARLSKSHKGNHRDIGKDGVHCELSEVLPQPITDHPVVGLGVEDNRSNTLPSSQQSEVPQNRRSCIYQKTNVLKEATGENSRANQLVIQCGPTGKSTTQVRQLIPEIPREEVSEGQTSSHEPNHQGVVNLLVQPHSPGLDSAFHYPDDNIHHHNRCVSDRLGLPHLQGDGRERGVEPIYEGTPHKYFRVYGCLDSTEANETSQEHINKTTVRQRYRRELYKEGGICAFLTSQPNDPVGNFSDEAERSFSFTSTCKRPVQRSCGSPLSRSPGLDRVGAGSSLHQMVIQADVHLPQSGPVRYPVQQQVPSLCVTDSDGGSSSNGRSEDGLESVGGGLSVSPLPTDFIGFGPPQQVSGQSHPYSPVVAQTALVPTPASNGQDFHQAPTTSAISDREWLESLRALLCDFSSSRLDFLKFAYRRSSTPIVVDYLTSALRTSTYRQYESVWRKFKSYVRDMQPSTIDLNFVMSFLIFCFEGGGWLVILLPYIVARFVIPSLLDSA